MCFSACLLAAVTAWLLIGLDLIACTLCRKSKCLEDWKKDEERLMQTAEAERKQVMTKCPQQVCESTILHLLAHSCVVLCSSC